MIDNYPEGVTEELEVVNNAENEELGSRKVPFSRELVIEREDFMIEPPKKYFRIYQILRCQPPRQLPGHGCVCR